MSALLQPLAARLTDGLFRYREAIVAGDRSREKAAVMEIADAFAAQAALAHLAVVNPYAAMPLILN
jgi:hypothetical protein